MTDRASVRGVGVGVGRSVRAGLPLLVGLLAAWPLSGCASPRPPQGDTGGRVSPTTTTDAEARSDQVLPGSLLEFSDQVARELAGDLAEQRVYGISDSEFLATVVFGDIVNKTQIVPTSDFEAARSIIRTRLMRSDVTREKIRFVENRRRLEELRSREWGDAEGLTVRRYNPEYTYFLNGTMYRVARGGTNLYSMDFELTHMTSGEIVFASNYLEKRR